MYPAYCRPLNEKEPYRMDKKINLLTAFLLLFSLVQCQDKKIDMENLPEYNVQICHPDNKYRIEFVSDHIKTLEGVHAGLPYGGTSGRWGDSGKGWTEQHGTPIGADIVYYADYEDTFYHLDVDFPVEKMKELVKRAYATGYADVYKKPLQEYIVSDKDINFDSYNNPYDSLSDLIFGFAPKGMVVVWVNFGNVQIEVGRYQAKVIREDEKLKKWFDDKFAVSKEELKKDSFLPDASPEQWDNYRNRYLWKPVFSPDNKEMRMFWANIAYYNGEREYGFRPFILTPQNRERAIPKEIQIIYRLSNKKTYESYVFFNWEKTNEAFKKLNSTPASLEIKVADDNNSVEVLLNGQPLETDSIRMYSSEMKFPDIE